MKSIKEKNKEYYDSEIIPATKENYKKILKLTYRRMNYPPLLATVIIGFLILPFSTFFLLTDLSLVLSISISLILFSLFYGLAPLSYVKLTFFLAKKDPNASFRKYGYLSKYDKED